MSSSSPIRTAAPAATRTSDLLSRPLLTVAGVLLAAGMVAGVVTYLGRSQLPEEHRPDTAAWGPHLALAAVAAILLAGAVWWHRRRGPEAPRRLLLLAPLGQRAERRIRHTLRSLRQPTVALRVLVGLLPAALMAFMAFRVGMQVTGGLDPNFTVNAWGGPSYLGAMFCHYLDAGLFLALAAGLLHLLLLPDPRR